MYTQKVSTRLFRLVAVMIVLVMIFSQTAGLVQARKTPPQGKEKVDVNPISIDEVKNYYGRLSDIQGPIGVVVELEDPPAALIYAQNTGIQVSALTINQVNLIQQKQSVFMKALKTEGIQATELYRTQKVYNGIYLRVDPASLDKIAAIPGVKALHPIISKTVDNNTSVPLVGTPQVWGGSGTYQGSGITIGILDTGIDYIHTNFGGTGDYTGQDFTSLDEPGNAFPTAKVVGGWDFVGDDYNANDPSPVIAPDPDPMDCYGHGSHVAGTAAGYGVNADGTTYQETEDDTYADLKDLSTSDYIEKFRIGPGEAPKADLFSLRIFGCEGSTDMTDLAIEWAMDPNNDGNLSDHLDVINMSLGSPFGSEYDTSAVASNNAAQAGIIVVASAGNEGDVYYITGSPAVASHAISVASSVDLSSVFDGFEVTANTAADPQVLVGLYPATLADFGPQAYNQSGDLAYSSLTDEGCAAYPPGTFTGKIALINRGTCSFVIKVKNAQNAGAVGVLIANNSSAFPVPMGGTDATITIPSMMTTLAVGTALKSDMTSGVVTVLLTTDNPGSVILTDPTIVDTVSTFSSRGPARADTLLKPDLTAPGDTIFSTKSGSGNLGANFSGTSMASPQVAGAMAVLREGHPTWTVAELKALVMNTATHDLWTSTAHTAKYTPTRVGAGRLDVENASLSPVIAYNTANPEQVNLSFGEQEVLGTQTYVKSISLKNTGASPAEYNVAFVQYYQSNPGLTFSLLDASNAPLSNPVTIPASSTLEIKMKVTADATALTRARDGSISLTNGRQYFNEGGGYVTLTSADSNPTLRLTVHIAARPASNMSVMEDQINLPAGASGTFSLTPTGTPVVTTDDTSLVSILELKDIDPNEASSSGINNDADIQYVGVTSDYPSYVFTGSGVYFGIATYGKWDTTNSVEFDIYIDVNEDGNEDYVIFNTNYGFATGTIDDVQLIWYCSLSSLICDSDSYANGFSSSVNTNLYNNNVMLMPVGATSIGLEEGSNTDFDFYVVSYSREAPGVVDVSDLMSFDLAHQSFTMVDEVNTGEPVWFDAPAYSPTFDINYDKAAIAANHSMGLLLLHHHNALNTAEILEFPKLYLPVISK